MTGTMVSGMIWSWEGVFSVMPGRTTKYRAGMDDMIDFRRYAEACLDDRRFVTTESGK